MSFDYDVLVIGSGFGGSVTALRLTEKGYRVGVLEAGRRFADDQFAATSWRLRDYVWAPALGCYGILRMSVLRDVMVLSGAGVGGGSLGYANTLYQPPDAFYRDPRWASITDWKAELASCFDQAQRMLGVTINPVEGYVDRALQQVAADLGVPQSFTRTPVGVVFSARPGAEVPDPFFGGAGPDRRGCTFCGSCMTGCRGNAKNTLVKNYLYLAEQAGATVHPLTTVRTVRPHPDGGYLVTTRRTGGLRRRDFTAREVVFAAGALGTQRLLHRLRDHGHLPGISSRLGELSRTNSETMLGARTRRRDLDLSHGVAVTSSIHPDATTHIEPVRYGPGSNLMSLLATALAPGRHRWLATLRTVLSSGRDLRLYLSPKNWSQQTIVLVAMQPLDNSITLYRRHLFGQPSTGQPSTGQPSTGRRSVGRQSVGRQSVGRHLFGLHFFGRLGRLTSRPGIGEPNPRWNPVAHDVARRTAEKLDGVPMTTYPEISGRPVTGHFVGGCVIGAVVDPYQRLYGHPGLHVIDGSVIPANLGVNPSLTITALAERATARWPNAGDLDPRPPLGDPYQPLPPIPPRRPAVPPGAPGELRLT
ncbi:GMC oxidoreductase [Actinoplanes sp. DH11]|uniref:GMC oxidoreductase n=1 Tax=Actinoplanes sp. DH11 TaxID=2857011 RepID=UPI001E3F9DD6|nr:GMC family oxidoreductase [Actinoplanes sp. DH11]